MDARMFLDPRIQNPRQTYLSDLYRKRRAVYSYQPLKNSEWTAVPPQKRVRIIELLGTKRAVELCPPGLSDMWGISFKAPLGVSCIDTKRFKRKITPFWKPGWYGKNDAQQWQSLNCCSYLWPNAFKTRGRQWWKGMFASCFHPHFEIVSIFTSKTMIEKMSWQINFLWWLHDKCANPTQGGW